MGPGAKARQFCMWGNGRHKGQVEEEHVLPQASKPPVGCIPSSAKRPYLHSSAHGGQDRTAAPPPRPSAHPGTRQQQQPTPTPRRVMMAVAAAVLGGWVALRRWGGVC